MDKALLFFGVIIIIFGIVIFFLLLTSVMSLGKSIKDEYSSLPQVKRNEINSYALISAAVVLIGVIIVRKGFKR